MPKLMVGFAGEMGSGKGTATELIKKWFPDTPSFRFSDSLREMYAWLRDDLVLQHGFQLPQDASTKDLQNISTKVRELFGENSLERAIMARVEKDNSSSIIYEYILLSS